MLMLNIVALATPVHVFSFFFAKLNSTANMTTCLDFPIIQQQTFVVVFIFVVVVFVMRACRNRQ
jgi:hypothetical protein